MSWFKILSRDLNVKDFGAMKIFCKCQELLNRQICTRFLKRKPSNLRNFLRWWSSFFLFSHHECLCSFVSSTRDPEDAWLSSNIDLNTGATSSTTEEPHGQSQRLSKFLTWVASVELRFPLASDMSADSMKSWVQIGNTINQPVSSSKCTFYNRIYRQENGDRLAFQVKAWYEHPGTNRWTYLH